MIGPHWFVSIFGIGLLGGMGIFIYSQLAFILSIYWKISFIASISFTILSYLSIVCKPLYRDITNSKQSWTKQTISFEEENKTECDLCGSARGSKNKPRVIANGTGQRKMLTVWSRKKQISL
jgi:hypothetical protein